MRLVEGRETVFFSGDVWGRGFLWIRAYPATKHLLAKDLRGGHAYIILCFSSLLQWEDISDERTTAEIEKQKGPSFLSPFLLPLYSYLRKYGKGFADSIAVLCRFGEFFSTVPR